MILVLGWSNNNHEKHEAHEDHLFDQGYISFTNDERLLIVSEARDSLLDKWGIDAGTNVGAFDRDQQTFVDYHRANVFRGSWP